MLHVCAINRDPIVTIYNACAHSHRVRTHTHLCTWTHTLTHTHSHTHTHAPTAQGDQGPAGMVHVPEDQVPLRGERGCLQAAGVPGRPPLLPLPLLARPGQLCCRGHRQTEVRQEQVSQSVSQSVSHCTVACETNEPIYICSISRCSRVLVAYWIDLLSSEWSSGARHRTCTTSVCTVFPRIRALRSY